MPKEASFHLLGAMMLMAAIMTVEATAAAQLRGPIIADAPSLVLGDTWTMRYSDGSWEKRKFLKEDTGILVFEVSHIWKNGEVSQGILHLTRDLSVVRMLGIDGAEYRRFDPHSLGLQFPLAVGKEWQEQCQRFDQGRAVGTFVGTFKVTGTEAVAGPAGTFQTYRVEGQTYELQDRTRTWRFIHWYAPEVRMEVKLQAVEPNGRGTQFELVEFRPAGHRPPASFSVPDTFLGVWEGYWKEMILATKLTVENIEGDTASVIYWQGASRYPAFQAPSQQRAEGKFLDDRTLFLNVWDDAGNRWADVTFTRNSDGTLTGKWSSGGTVANATLHKEQ